ncbi:MAG: hypothetical protein J0L56_13485 [Chitinophagales bacterium]|nr:hypothetical protein [Chitinophagales bacterium]
MKGTDVFVLARSPWGDSLLRQRPDDETPGRKNMVTDVEVILSGRYAAEELSERKETNG